jgi:cytochrome c-type biogenesis protein CcmH/NrfG
MRLDDASAAHWLQQTVDTNPADVRLLALLGEAQFKAGDRDAARATIARGFELEPDQPALLALSRRVR